MKHFDWRCLAISSLALVLAANAETRPQYGGTLHIATHAVLTSLDPADGSQLDSFARRSVTLLMFDTMITTDDNGRVQPSLAESWQVSAGNRRWQFKLRNGVQFQDGMPLTIEIVAASLRAANPSWKVQSDRDGVVIEFDTGDPDLPAELALPRNAIEKMDANHQPIGTGPFQVVDWASGKKLTLRAEENYWGGRPFLDGIEIEMGKSFRDQITAYQLGKADLIEIAPEQVHRTSLEPRNLLSSAPVELVALAFTRDVTSADEKMLREALALSIDRGSMRSALLQGTGQPAASVLPIWLSGYAFVFSTDADLPSARRDCEQVRAAAHTIPAWALGYDGSDPLARLLADRIALNAKDAGLMLQPMTTTTTADLRIVRIPLASSDPWVALADVAALTGSSITKSNSDAIEDIYAGEQSLLSTRRLIPLFHLPTSYAVVASLNGLTLRPDGSWNAAGAWLESRKP
jgi:peptide/nickel transport system substrate-binding protein